MQADGVSERARHLDGQRVGQRRTVLELLKLVHAFLQIGDP